MPSCPIPHKISGDFSKRLLGWWDEHGRKTLPWQSPRDPYRVWVSEIMLQQTQVAAVIPYFERWMEHFPDVGALAQAPQDAVLSLWSGLGYYARARNLHAAAQACMEWHGGRLPESAEALRELPGIGPSTANAIVSLAYDRPASVLDGNVKRVLARHAGIEGWPGEAAVQRALWREAEARLPDSRAADYSQAIMDLGALVCSRTNPGCEACPVAGDCKAFELDATSRIPAPRPKRQVPDRIVHMLVVRDEHGRILLQKRPPDGIWGGLWSLPEGSSIASVRSRLGLDAVHGAQPDRDLPEFEHRLTHLRLRIRPSLMTWPPRSGIECQLLREESAFAWFDRQARESLGLPKPVHELLESLDNGSQT